MRNTILTKRYICRDDGDGRSTIMDIFTGLPADVHGRAFPRIRNIHVDEMLLALNMIDQYQRTAA